MTESPVPSGWLARYPAFMRLDLKRMLGRVPVVHQLSASDCGAACLAMTLSYHGRQVSLDRLRTSVGIDRDGTTAAALLAAARSEGLRGRAVTMDVDGLPFLSPGAILFWDFRHFVVFESCTARKVCIVDPAVGRRVVPMDRFRRSFTGVALVLEPTAEFEPAGAGNRQSWSGWAEILRHRETLARICVTSLWMQVFGLALPFLMGVVVDRIIPRRDYNLLLVVALGIVLLNACQMASTMVRSHLLLNLRTNIDARLTLGFLEHLVSLPYQFFQQRTTGDLLLRLSSNSAVREIATSGVISGVLDGLVVFVYLLIILSASPPLCLLVLGLGGARVVALLAFVGRQRQLMSQTLETQAKARSYEVEMLAGIETLKVMGAEHHAVHRWSNLFVDTLNMSLVSGRLNIRFDAVMGGLAMASPLLLLGTGSVWVLNGDMTLGTMLALNALGMAFISPLSSLVGSVMQFQIMRSYVERISDVLETAPEQYGDKVEQAGRLTGHITLDAVSFRYGPNAPLVVRNVSAEILPGQQVAFVGRSGSGKSTLANLLVGLAPCSDGRILIDEVDLRHFECRSVRAQVGIVTQMTHLFGGSIRSNIALTNPELPLDRVIEAGRLAQIHDEIMAMPMGYETLLIEGGTSLSGGQRQRIALARALVRRPAFIILDEATSQLDAITEQKIMENLRRIQVTMIISAHRLSTIAHADVILVIEQGEVVERGNHQKLLALGGLYSALVKAQVSTEATATNLNERMEHPFARRTK